MDSACLGVPSSGEVSFLFALSSIQAYKRGYHREECFLNKNWFKCRTLSQSKGQGVARDILTKAGGFVRVVEKFDSFSIFFTLHEKYIGNRKFDLPFPPNFNQSYLI